MFESIGSQVARDRRPDLTGANVARFRVLKLLGAGGMGQVYLAEDTILHRRVALKRLTVSGGVARERLLREAKQACSFTDPNVAQLYDIVEESGELFLVMEYIQGQTLRTLIPSLSVEDVLKIAMQCASALAAAHEHGIVHHDIKPENIMIADGGQVKIFDFGVAKRMAGGTVTMTTTDLSPGSGGTVAYMAPEVLREEKSDGRADQFSLGVVLYEVLTGTHPFLDRTFALTIDGTLNREPQPLRKVNPRVPEDFANIVTRMLSKDPDRRYATANDLLRELRALVLMSSRGELRDYVDRQRKTGMLKWVAVVAILIVGLGMILRETTAWKNVMGPVLPSRKHLVVLPFTVESQDPKLSAFARGLTETVTASIGQVGETSSFLVVPASEVRDQKITSAQQARTSFGANLVLEGSLRMAGDRVRVTYTVIDARSKRALRGDTITASVGDPFSLEDSVADSVLTALKLASVRQTVNPRHATRPEAYDFYLQGRGYMQDYHRPENLDNAVTVLNHALELDPKYAPAYAGLGEVYWAMYERTRDAAFTQRAIDACNKAATLGGAGAEAHLCLGTIYNGTGKYEDAVTSFQQALQMAPKDDAAYRGLAAAYQKLNRPEDAEATFKQAIAMRPNYWAAYSWLGSFYYRYGRFAEAEAMYRSVVRLEPDNARGYSNLGGVLLAQNRYNEAIPVLEEGLQKQPTPAGYSNVATAYFYLKKYPEAVRNFQKATELRPKDYLMWANLADAQIRLPEKREDAIGNYKKSIELAQSEIKVNARNGAMYAHLARYYSSIGDKKQARTMLKKALGAEGVSPDSLYEAAVVELNLGSRDAALEYLDRAIKAGYSPVNVVQDDTWEGLKSDPRFNKLTRTISKAQ